MKFAVFVNFVPRLSVNNCANSANDSLFQLLVSIQDVLLLSHHFTVLVNSLSYGLQRSGAIIEGNISDNACPHSTRNIVSSFHNITPHPRPDSNIIRVEGTVTLFLCSVPSHQDSPASQMVPEQLPHFILDVFAAFQTFDVQYNIFILNNVSLNDLNSSNIAHCSLSFPDQKQCEFRQERWNSVEDAPSCWLNTLGAFTE